MTTNTLSEAGFEAAREAWLESASDYTRLDVSIAAAIRAYLAQAAPVAVKGLEWKPYVASLLQAVSPVAAYTIYPKAEWQLTVCTHNFTMRDDVTEVLGCFESEKGAKAAAQADYETRIRSALSPTLAVPGDVVAKSARDNLMLRFSKERQAMTSNLIERLRATEEYDTLSGFRRRPVNPDGIEAADHIASLEAALRATSLGLDDLMRTLYSPELYRPEHVAESHDRIGRAGAPLAYVADLQEQAARALSGEENKP